MTRDLSKEEKEWLLEYEYSRYLKYVSDKDLLERLKQLNESKDLLHEWCYKEYIENDNRSIGFWKRKIFQTKLELQNRNLSIPEHDLTAIYSKTKPYSSIKPNNCDILVKYGVSKFMKELHTSGNLRVSLAGGYLNETMNEARHDNEMSKSAFINKMNSRLETIDGQVINPIKNPKLTDHAVAPYYIYCCATDFDWYFFDKFQCDSCVIIKDVPEFKRRLNSKMKEILPKWYDYGNIVQYYDEFECRPSQIDSHTNKTLKYAYQKEYRFSWIPFGLKAEYLESNLDVSLGSLVDICDYYELSVA